MTFLWPKLLWLYALLPVLVAAYVVLLKRKKKNALRYANLNIVKAAMRRRAGFRRHIPPALFLVATAVMVFAIARPAAYVTLPADRGTVILAMDVSGSMRARDIEPSRLDASENAARSFVQSQPSDVLIGIVAFSGTANVVQAPTTNKDDVLAAIGRFQAQRGTAIGNGIIVSLQTIFKDSKLNLDQVEQDQVSPFGGGGFGQFGQRQFGQGQLGQNQFGQGQFGQGQFGQGQFGQGQFGQGSGNRFGNAAPLGQTQQGTQQEPPPVEPGSFRSAVIILLSDGQATTGIDPIAAANKAADLGIRIFTVGLGTTQGQILGFGGRSMRVQLDEATLKRIAEITHAKYFRADSGTNLSEIYHELSTQLILERKQTELTAFFTAIAALLALGAAGISVLWFNRLL